MPKTPNFSQEKFLSAYRFSAEAHRGQKYPGTGLPYLMHITSVSMEVIALLEVEPFKDPDLMIQCAILHDVIEDTKVSKRRLEEVFGKEIAQGVESLTKKKRIKDKEKRFTDNMARLKDAPREIQAIKLADRISNLQTPPFHWDSKKIASYLEKSKIILKELGNASPYLNIRLKEKIALYPELVNHRG